ncbi:MAG: FG-GAP-like repeat-containing protein, partial [Pirellulales bacterium]
GTTSFTLTILPASSRRGSLSNTAAVTAPAGTIDLVPANNTASDTDTALVPADLSVTKTDGSSTYVPGQNVTYTITTTNNGPDPVTGAVVTDVLPTGTTFVSATGGAAYNALTNTVSYTAGTLAVGGTTSFTLTILPASSRRGSLSNTARVTAPAGTIDLVPGNNTASDVNTVVRPVDLWVTKTDGSSTYVPGETVTYTVTVGNAGPRVATGAVVTDVLPTGTTFVSATGGATYSALTNTVSYTTGTLAVGGQETFTISILPVASRQGSLSNTATVTAPAGMIDLVPANNSASDVDAMRSTPLLVASSDLGCDATPLVTVIDPSSGETRSQFSAYEPGFRGGLRSAVGDLDGDAVDEIVVAPGPGRAGEIRVFTLEGVERTSFRSTPFGAAYGQGIEVSVGDVNGDGRDDIVAAKSRGAGEVTVLSSSGTTVAPLASFVAFPSAFNGGATVTVADMGRFGGTVDRTSTDGIAEILVGSGPGMAPTVLIYSVIGSPRIVDGFMPLSAAYQGGFSLSAQRFNTDAIPDVLVAAGRSAAPTAVVYDGVSKAQLANYAAFASLASATAPVFAALADVDGDGRADDVFMTQGTGSESRGVRRLSVATATASTPVATALLAGPMRIATRGARR